MLGILEKNKDDLIVAKRCTSDHNLKMKSFSLIPLTVNSNTQFKMSF